jgi:hypothetical protein
MLRGGSDAMIVLACAALSAAAGLGGRAQAHPVVGAWIVRHSAAPFQYHMYVFNSDGTMQQANPDAGNARTSDSDGKGIWTEVGNSIKGKFVEMRADRATHAFIGRGEISFAFVVRGGPNTRATSDRVSTTGSRVAVRVRGRYPSNRNGRPRTCRYRNRGAAQRLPLGRRRHPPLLRQVPEEGNHALLHQLCRMPQPVMAHEPDHPPDVGLVDTPAIVPQPELGAQDGQQFRIGLRGQMRSGHPRISGMPASPSPPCQRPAVPFFHAPRPAEARPRSPRSSSPAGPGYRTPARIKRSSAPRQSRQAAQPERRRSRRPEGAGYVSLNDSPTAPPTAAVRPGCSSAPGTARYSR